MESHWILKSEKSLNPENSEKSMQIIYCKFNFANLLVNKIVIIWAWECLASSSTQWMAVLFCFQVMVNKVKLSNLNHVLNTENFILSCPLNSPIKVTVRHSCNVASNYCVAVGVQAFVFSGHLSRSNFMLVSLWLACKKNPEFLVSGLPFSRPIAFFEPETYERVSIIFDYCLYI